MENKFWLENPYILINNENYLKFFPTSSMSRVEQLNAITRLCIYYIIVMLLLGKNNMYLGLPIIIIIFIIVIYLIYKNDYQGKYEDFIIRKMNKNNKEKKMHKINDMIESGYYDFDGKLILGKKYGIDSQTLTDQKAKDFVNYDFNELMEYEKNSCRRPTKDNPFMNPPVTDFGKENIPVACNSDDDDIKQNMERNFNVDLYRDLDDLFDNKNSQRVWYTIPVTAIPNDQESFANWLYKTDNVCKSNQDSCLRYEDLRFKR
jgi:hypothetical protein